MNRSDVADRIGWWLLWALVFSIPWEKSVWAPGVGTISRTLGGLALAAGAAAALRRRSVRAPNLALALGAAFVAWSAATYFWSLDPGATAARAWTFVQLLAMCWLVWDQCRRPEQPAQLIEAYVGGALVVSLATLTRYVQGQQTNYRRYAAAGFDPNDLALTVALAIPLALYLAWRAQGWRAWLYRLALLPALAAILLAASRAALIAAFIAFLFTAFTWRKSDNAQRISGVALAGLLALGTVWLAPGASRERLATLPLELTQGTLHNRTHIWKAGLRALKRHPVRGVGAAAFPEAVRPALGVPPIPGHAYVAHSTFLSTLVEGGAIGFSLFTALLSALALFVWVMPPGERALWGVTLAVWAAGVSMLTWEHRKPTWLLFALIMSQWAFAFRPAKSV